MMQRNTIVPILSLILMFGMFVYYDLKVSTQYSVVDSVWPVIFLGIITFVIIVARSQDSSVGDFLGSLILIPFGWIMSYFHTFEFKSPLMGGTKENSDNSALKENLHHRITKMLDEDDKYDEYTVTTILKELENIKE